ncbi:hypothetical protein T10_11477 [Trichinella papuae]|uniref:Uncharacterized protein n=1 Tax=Trichinella papuae TaxID=268474 RepID=A0A0V1M1Q7_9BILA|nr:hypothetical protein T10_11477 [Trichinella papuae]
MADIKAVSKSHTNVTRSNGTPSSSALELYVVHENMKCKQLLVPGWENLQDLIHAPPITLSQKPHTSLGGKNQYIVGRPMIYSNLLTGICCSLLGSGLWFLPSFRDVEKSPGPAVVHYVTGLVPSWKITSSI